MKTLIRFSKEDSTSSLETSKYLENLYKSLEFARISYTNNLLEKAEIAHFISPIEEKQINDAYLEDLHVVISVGYCEEDERHKFFSYKENGKPTLTNKAVRVLKQADLILVPTQIIKDYLVEQGIEVCIKIVTAGVDVEKFSAETVQKPSLFDRYFQRRPNHQYVLCHGHGEEEGINSILKIAHAVPSIDFYYLVDEENLSNSISLSKKNSKDLPKNLVVSHSIPSDVYVAGLKKAIAYLSLPVSTGDFLGTFEAFAAKTQVIYMDENRKHGIFENRENVLISANDEKSQKLIWLLSTDQKIKTVESAYQFALNNSLQIMGAQLKSAYESLLKK